MKKWMTILLLAVLVLVLAGAGALYNDLKDQVQTDSLVSAQPSQEPAGEDGGETEPPRTMAPDFTVYDDEGNACKLSDFRGKPVILNFWATWCGYCVQEMPEFQTAFEESGEKVHFLMVNVTDGGQETQEKASEFIAGQGFSFPVYYDLDLSAAYAYSVSAMPVTYFIDEEGYFVAWSKGAMSLETLNRGIALLTE